MLSSKLMILVLFLTLLTLSKTQSTSEANVFTTGTDLPQSETASPDCLRKLTSTANFKSIFNIGSIVYIRYASVGANGSDYNYFIYDTDTKEVTEKTDHSLVFPGSNSYRVAFAAAIIGVPEYKEHNNFMITIEMTSDKPRDEMSSLSYFTYKSDDNGKQWKKITNANDLPNFHLKTHDEIRIYTNEKSFWPKEAYEHRIEGFGFYTRDRIFVILYGQRVSQNKIEIKYKQVSDILGVHTEGDWIALSSSPNSVQYFRSLFEMSDKFYACHVFERKSPRVAYIIPLEFERNGNQNTYFTSTSTEMYKHFFQCVIPGLGVTDPNRQTFIAERYRTTTTSESNKKSNIFIILAIFVCVIIACVLITVVVFWTLKKQKQASNELEIENTEEQSANKEQVAAEEDVADDTKRQSSKLSTVSALSTSSRRSRVQSKPSNLSQPIDSNN